MLWEVFVMLEDREDRDVRVWGKVRDIRNVVQVALFFTGFLCFVFWMSLVTGRHPLFENPLIVNIFDIVLVFVTLESGGSFFLYIFCGSQA